MTTENKTLIQRLRVISVFSILAISFVLPFSIALIEIFVAVSIIGWFILKLVQREKPISSPFFLYLLITFFLVSCVSIVGSGYPLQGLRGALKLLKYIFLLLAVADLFSEPLRLRRLVVIGLIAFVCVGLDTIIQEITGQDFVRHFPVRFADSNIRLSGPFRQYGLLAAYLIAIFPIFISLMTGRTLMGVKWFGLVGISVVALYLLYKTHSRGAWLAAFGSLSFLAVILRNKGLLIALLVTLLLTPIIIPRNVLIHLDITRKEQSLVERCHLWLRALQAIKAKPLFGCGINTYVLNYSKYDQIKSWRVPGYYAHNGYLQLAAETGLIALGLFLWIIFLALRCGYQAYKSGEPDQKPIIAGFMAGTIALLLQAGVDTTLHNLQSATLIWFYLGLLFAFGTQAKAAHSQNRYNQK